MCLQLCYVVLHCIVLCCAVGVKGVGIVTAMEILQTFPLRDPQHADGGAEVEAEAR